MIVEEEDYLAHYGTPRKSGRYPWGSGKTDSERNRSFLSAIKELQDQGMSNKDVAKALGLKSSTELVRYKSIAVNQQKQEMVNRAERLQAKGLSKLAIGREMGINESTVRSLLAPGRKDRLNILQSTADMLKRQVEEKEMIDVGLGVEHTLPIGNNPAAAMRISKDKLATAVAMLQKEGYQLHHIDVLQQTTGEMTKMKVLCKPDVTWSEAKANAHKIRQITEVSPDHGRNWEGALRPPTNISSKRIDVNWAEQGGAHKDGLIELRPGVKDLDMGGKSYAQVRIAVDGTHYLKGMAVYNPDLPAGVDIRFNTNKPKSADKLDALKPQETLPNGKINKANPFTASIKIGGQRGALNIINEEGDWDKHSKSLSSQMLSKQSPHLAKTQLDMTHERRRAEFEEIKSLTNPAVKKKLLKSFSDETDSAAVHLEAAHLPGQVTKVLIPIPQVKPDQIFAPSFNNGDRVALVRFPHGGTFEIPELTVNNRNPHARKLLGNSPTDAVGINHKVAERLSGADFDGDYVLVIPNHRGSVKSTPPLEGLRGFDPQASHPPYDGMPTIDGGRYNAAKKRPEYPKLPDGTEKRSTRMQDEMGKITNLIADMTVKGANTTELARAVRHSMVVIDAEKKHLDFKGSFEVNGIAALKERYQGGPRAGASTLITKAGSSTWINKRKPRPAKDGGPIDKATGKKVFVDTGDHFINSKGVRIDKKEEVELLSVTEDAHKLVSDHGGTKIEHIYADHSNRLKTLGNEARKEMIGTSSVKMNKSAKRIYAKEVESLEAKLIVAERNAPLERQAQVVAGIIVKQHLQSNLHLTNDQKRKIRNRSIKEARVRVGADKTLVTIEPHEWLAIQAGAISNHKLEKILNNADLDVVKKLATPKVVLKMTSTKTSRAKQMLANGFTQAEVAAQLGVSLTTLKTSLE